MPTVPMSEVQAAAVAALRDGARMPRQEFHRLYEQAPSSFNAELIGGVVYVGGRVRVTHGTFHCLMTALLGIYHGFTPGTEGSHRGTVFLAEDSEPQPDVSLRLTEECGGQSRITSDDYLEGAPELVVEISDRSSHFDLYAKKTDYQKYGVREYVVVDVENRRLLRFDLAKKRELFADADGVHRSAQFPGLWIDERAMFADDSAAAIATVNAGLATAEHAAFVAKLAAAKARDK
jgi:Uma2 family endonuclease